MVSLSVNLDTVVYHTEYAGYNTDIVACRLKDWSLFNVEFKHCLIILWIKSVRLITLVAGCLKSHTECLCRIKN